MKDDIVLSYPFLDTLYTYSIHSKKYKSVSAKSIFQKTENKPEPITNDIKSYYRSNQNTTAYWCVSYDKYRDVFYRFVLHPNEVDINKNIISLSEIRRKKPVSIQILSNKFELMGEIMLPKDKYQTDDFFVSKKGIYISNNNSENKSFNEDQLSYTLFSLQKLNH